MVDFFISYNRDDEFDANIIYNWLVDEKYTCVMQKMDFIAGSNFILEMQNATKNCERTIALFSPSYFNSKFAQSEWAAAFLKDPIGSKQVLIPVRIRECQPEGLLSAIVYIDLVGLDAETRREIFLKSIKRIVTGHKHDISPQVSQERKQKEAENEMINQKILGNNNIQVGGNFIVNNKPPEIKILPSPSSIGADTLLKSRIIELFNKIGESREKRFGKKSYTVMYNNFKKDFGIKNNKWTIIWDWPNECAPAILDYLQTKYKKTMDGRIEHASARIDYRHTRPHLYRKERELLSHLGLELGSQKVKLALKDFFGVTSHSKITHLQHWLWVCYLEGVVQSIEEE